MSNPHKRWSELTPAQVEHYFRLCAKRADDLDDLANSTWREFCKYLFAANTGAAAGLFLMPDAAGKHWYLTAFSLFCLGVFSVGLAWFGSWAFYKSLAEGWTADFNAAMRDDIPLGELDARNRNRRPSLTSKLSRIGLVISFALLLAGGVVAGKGFWSNPPAQAVTQKQPVTARSIVTSNQMPQSVIGAR
ncbi:MAG: hypothetical protein QM813_27690 [Verrucomicrobiota bacterium]